MSQHDRGEHDAGEHDPGQAGSGQAGSEGEEGLGERLREAGGLGDASGGQTSAGQHPGGVHADEASQPAGAVSGEIGLGEAVDAEGDLGSDGDLGETDDAGTQARRDEPRRDRDGDPHDRPAS